MRNDGTHAGPAKNKTTKADEALESWPSLPEPEVKEQYTPHYKVEYSLKHVRNHEGMRGNTLSSSVKKTK